MDAAFPRDAASPTDAAPAGDASDHDGGADPAECTSDEDCSNADVCDGIERCVDEACVPGAQLGCFDGAECSFDLCEPSSGCAMVAPDTDADGADDCNDCAPADPDVRPGALDVCNDRDDDCDLAIDEDGIDVYFADCDDDGHAPRDATTYTGCAAPDPATTGCGAAGAAWITNAPSDPSYDCDDTDARAHSGQSELFASPLLRHVTGLEFDFDCDGRITFESTASGECASVGTGCEHTPGWATGVPVCGAEGSFVVGCDAACGERLEMRVQRCR